MLKNSNEGFHTARKKKITTFNFKLSFKKIAFCVNGEYAERQEKYKNWSIVPRLLIEKHEQFLYTAEHLKIKHPKTCTVQKDQAGLELFQRNRG